ncbi:hypothetical protein CR513_30847, partial [Mucuna pruriens]
MIHSDHEAHKNLRGQGKLSRRLSKWVEFLEQFSYVIKHKQARRILYAPMNSIRQLLVKKAHEGGLMGHFGELKTLVILNEHFYWPQIKRDAYKICEKCLTCKVPKSRVSPCGFYTSLLIPTSLWIDISMHFVLGLPRSKRGRDFIFVAVDRFSKMGHFIPCHNSDNASHVTNLFFRDVVWLHGLLRTILSYKDTKFLRHFWRFPWSRLTTKLLFSTTCHPQMNGQTEIPHIEFAYNRVYNSTTSYSQFELAYVFNSLSPLDLFPLPIMPHCVNNEGLLKVKLVQNLHDKAWLDMEKKGENMQRMLTRGGRKHPLRKGTWCGSTSFKVKSRFEVAPFEPTLLGLHLYIFAQFWNFCWWTFGLGNPLFIKIRLYKICFETIVTVARNLIFNLSPAKITILPFSSRIV